MATDRPGSDTIPSLLSHARETLRCGSWQAARGHFEQALAREEGPEALEGLGLVAWWLEDVTTVFATRERAYRLFRARHDRLAAGRLATEIGFDYAIFRAELAVCNGWLQRAHRLLDDLAPAPEQIWLALRESELAYHIEGDVERVRRLGTRAKELANALGLIELEMLGLAVEGQALVGQGDTLSGMRRLDEAAAAAVSGEFGDFKAVASILCLIIVTCEQVRDFDRASEWCLRFMAYCSANDLQTYLALCRLHYASILTARGQWAEAENQLTQALNGLRYRIAWSLSALEQLGELRRRQGRIEEADHYFDQIQLLPSGILGKARLALDAGDSGLALDLVQRVLRRLPNDDRYRRLAPLELLVRIHCERGDVAAAEEALRELEAIAGSARTPSILAMASYGHGMVTLTAGQAAAAKAHLEDALDLYEANHLPYEAGLVQVDLGRTLCAVGRLDLGLDHIRIACDIFKGLGAQAESTRAGKVARILSQTQQRVAAEGTLSRRESEVLHLLAQGLSNEEIAQTLVLSKHTVRRHVSSILAKLCVSSRTAAAVYALSHEQT